MIKKINIATVLILLASINIAFSQFQVPTNYLPGSNMNQTPVVNKATGSNKVTKREVVNSAKQKNDSDSLINQRQSESLIATTTEEDSIKKAKIAFQNKIFGFSIFNNKAGVFETNLKIATPKNYVLGPDDELIVDINGYSEEHYNLTVNADGYIKISKIGKNELQLAKIRKSGNIGSTYRRRKVCSGST